jgi:hypothetical protein
MSGWQILVTSIPHRHQKLLRLLDALDQQLPRTGVGVLLYRDDLELCYGGKIQALVEASTADYVCCVDDDDMVAPDYVEKIAAVLEELPQYVGFRVRWTQNTVPQKPVVHSLACGGWQDTPGQLERDISEKNPVRRDIALLGTWEGGWEAERRWSAGVRAAGVLKYEVFIDEELYYYQETLGDSFSTSRQPLGHMPELPDYPWLRQIGPYA